MKDIESAVQETIDNFDMIEERIPGIKPRLDEMRLDLARQLTETFQPFIDLGEGRITQEEFDRIMASRAAADLAKREAMWGEPDEEGEWLVQCQEPDCPRSSEDLVFEELPPLWPTHEDVDGVPCVEEDEDEEEEDEEEEDTESLPV